MLPEISLDNSTFEEIVKKARSQIEQIYPTWTDYNYHDPGITILELFAFLKEAQQFYIDQTSDDIRKKFLQLMGISLKKRQASHTTIKLLSETRFTVPIGSKFYMNKLCFETIKQENILGDIIKYVIVKPKYGDIFKSKLRQMKDYGNMVVYPFGKKTGVGSEFFICLNEPLEKGKYYSFSILLDENYSVSRNPIKDINSFIPLSKIDITYFDGEKYSNVKYDDYTLGIIRSGEIVFSIPTDMIYSVEEEIGGYFIKISLVEDNLDVAPAIKSISFNNINLIQKDTKAVFLDIDQLKFWKKDNIKIDYYYFDENNGCYINTTIDKAEKVAVYENDFYKNKILAIGNGLPNQSYNLPQNGIMSDNFEILVSSIRYKGFLRKWIKVDNFDSSKVDDCHYIVDEENNCIHFGNGIRGRMPEGEIIIVSCAFSMGKSGNIKAGQNIEFPYISDNLKGYSIYDAIGGANPETLEEGLIRVRDLLSNDERAVSENDYEEIIKKTPGLRIWDCKVLENSAFNDDKYENEVRIVVRPYSENRYAVLSKAYEKNILNHIMGKRLIGSSIRLYSPVYIEVEVYVQLRIKPQYIQAEKKIDIAVRDFFDKLNGFGSVINYGSLFACIDGLDEVMEIYTLYVDARGDQISRNSNGDVKLPPLGVLLLKKVDCIIIH